MFTKAAFTILVMVVGVGVQPEVAPVEPIVLVTATATAGVFN